MIGICARYQKHDATFAALALARLLEQDGHKMSFLQRGWRAIHVDSRWDHVPAGYKLELWKWFGSKEVIVWTEYAPEAYLVWLLRNRIKMANILYTSWDAINRDNDMAVCTMKHIFVPTEEQARVLGERWKHHNICVMPYTPWLPPTIKSGLAKDGHLHFFMSLFGSQLRRVDIQAVTRLADVMRRRHNVTAIIAASKGIRAGVRNKFLSLARELAPRLKMIMDCPWHAQQLYMSAADMTIWPAMIDGHGIIPRTSLSLGTPVLGFDYHPANAVIRSGVNGILIKVSVERNWIGMEMARPDWDVYEKVIDGLAAEPAIVAKLMGKASIECDKWHSTFVRLWREVLPDSVVTSDKLITRN